MKTALITGATKGIGLATTQLFIERGYFVFAVGRNQTELAQLQNRYALNIKTIACDLSDRNSRSELIQAVFSECDQKQKPLDVLINNAGQFLTNTLESSHLEEWKQQMEINFFSVVDLTRGLIPLLKRSNPGSIVNVSSTLGLRSSPATGAYSASKAALQSFSTTLAQELAPFVRVNVVCPGLVETPIHSFFHLPEAEKVQVIESLANKQPMNRIGKPTEIAQSLFFLGDSATSPWTTGAILSVDGGINLV